MGLRNLDARDVHYYGGSLLVSVGCGGAWGWPAALFALGVALIAPAVWGGRRGAA